VTEREALLAQLRDPLPPLVSWWPLAPGWWILAGLLLGLALLLVLGRLWRRRHRQRAWQRQARAELGNLRVALSAASKLPDTSSKEVLSAASVLTRRVLLAVLPRARVAALHGDAWLHTLDSLAGGRQFTDGPGRWLATGPFQRQPALDDNDLSRLLDAIESLIANADKPVAGRRE